MRLTIEEVKADPIFRALNPEGKEFMSARMLPDPLNPFRRKYGIHMAALIPFGHFHPHIKAYPALQMMLEDFENGLYEDKHTIVVDSSGNTAHAVARLARAFGFKEVKVVLSADVPESKKGILAALSSVEIIEVGGGKSVAHRAEEETQKPGHYHLNQYGHMGNVRAHQLYTAPEIIRVLREASFQEEPVKIGAIAAAMGSAGTAAGIGAYFKNYSPATTIIGVRPLRGQQVPGARDEKRMADVVTIPWKPYVHHIEEVSRKESFKGMRRLWSAVEPQPGPTSGLAWVGLEQYLRHLERQDRLEEMVGQVVAFICPDDGRFYSERTTGELDTDQGVELSDL